MDKQKIIKLLMITILILLIVIFSFFSYLIFKHKNNRQDSNNITSSKYTNTRLGYEINIPKDYRLATQINQWMNTIGPNPINDFKDKNYEYVLITSSDINDENKIAAELKKSNNSDDLFFLPKEYLAKSSIRKSIEIYPTSTDIEFIKNFSNRLKESGKKASSDFKDIILSNELKATQYIEKDIANDEEMRTTYIPFKKDVNLRGGDKIEGLLIKMNLKPDIFDEAAYNGIVNSFSLN